MPNIRGIDLSDGIQILGPNWTAGNNPHYSKAALEDYLSTHSIEQAENAANTWLNNHCEEFGVLIAVHIYSASPLSATCYCTDIGNEIPDNWWE